jgi:hypothetical protein
MRISLVSLAAVAALAFATPSSAQVATTMCTDGTPSVTNGRGACSGHGGVDRARTKAARKAVKAEAKEVVQEAKDKGAMVECGDGSMSKTGRGACSRHKGVKIATPPAPMSKMSPAMPAHPAMPAAMQSPMMHPAPASRAMPASPANASSHRAEDSDPTGALAQCKDGMYSHSASRRGACSRHKGVAKWMQP